MAWGAAFAAIVSYAALLRPAVRVDAGALVLRNMIDTNVIPLALIDEVVVRQVLVVRADEKRYVSPAIGNSFFRTDPPQDRPRRRARADLPRLRPRPDPAPGRRRAPARGLG